MRLCVVDSPARPEQRTRLRAAAAVLAGLLAITATAMVMQGGVSPAADIPPVIAGLGGDFELAGAGGTRVRLQDYRGRPLLLFFGYTHCPDVCPTTLVSIKQAVEKLGPSPDRVQVIMVTLDPRRDPPDQLAQYMQFFDPRFVGLSGTPEEIQKVAAQYRVFYRQGDGTRQGQYSISHSAYVYALDRRGRVRAVIAAAAKPAEISGTMQTLLRESAPAR